MANHIKQGLIKALIFCGVRQVKIQFKDYSGGGDTEEALERIEKL